MTVTYITKGGALAVPDEPNQPLHKYHNDIEQLLGDGVSVNGLTGKGDGIRRIVVSDELSESAKSDLENYLKTSLAIVDNEPS